MKMPANEKPVKSVASSKSNDKKEECLKCNGRFVNLAKHSCKVSEEVGKPEKKKDDVRKKTFAKNEKLVKSDALSKESVKKEQCITCNGQFVNLEKHNCKILQEIDKPNEKNKMDKAIVSKKEKLAKRATSSESESDDGRIQCSKCNGRFVNLTKHNCKKSEVIVKPNQNNNMEEPIVSKKEKLAKRATSIESDDGRIQCSKCNGRFVNLTKHNCKKSEEIVKPNDKNKMEEQIVSKKEKLAKRATSTESDDGRIQCSKCNGWFVDLTKHNCKKSEEIVKPNDKNKIEEQIVSKKEKLAKRATSTESDDGRIQCSKCNGWFVDLTKHNCKKSEEIVKPNQKQKIEKTISQKKEKANKIDVSSKSVEKKDQCVKCERTKEKEVVAKPTFSKDPMKDIKSRLNDDKIGRTSSATVASETKKIYEALIIWLNENDEYFKPWKAVTTGSSYEKLKIKEPDEFDVMFVATGITAEHKCNTSPSCSIEQTFCKMGIDSRTNLPPDMCNKDGNFLSPKAFKLYFRKMFLAALDNSPSLKGLKRHIKIVNDDIKGSPALQIAVELGKDKEDIIDIDLVPSLQVTTWPGHSKRSKSTWVSGDIKKECHAVCKLHTSEYDKEASECTYWRLSFSHVEKQMMLHADGNNKKTNMKTCRKKVLKVIKSLLCDVKTEMEEKNILKGRQPVISSYHCKTLMFHCYDDKNKDEDWSDEADDNQLRTMLKETLFQLIQHLETGNLHHYFIPAVNLLQKMTKKEKDFLIEKFNYFFIYY